MYFLIVINSLFVPDWLSRSILSEGLGPSIQKQSNIPGIEDKI